MHQLKRHRLAKNTCMYALPLTSSFCLTPQIVIILYSLVNRVPIITCNCNYLLFFIWLLIVKTDKHLFYYCDYVTITHLIPLYHDWSIEKL